MPSSTPPAASSVPNSAQVSVPEDLQKFRVDDLNELSQLPTELSGIWEAAAQGEETNKHLREQANRNIERANNLQSQLDEIEQLRQTVDELESQVATRYDEWIVAESDMQTAIEPFSEFHLARRIEQERDASRAEGESLRTSLLEGEDIDVVTFVREFRRRQQLSRLRHNSLRAIY